VTIIREIKKQVLNGTAIDKGTALLLAGQPLDELAYAADEIREYYCGNKFDICSIVNAKSGRCSEDCKFCAQSAFYNTGTASYKLLSKNEITELAKYNAGKGVLRYSIVTSGEKPTGEELDLICEIISDIKTQTSLNICASLGLLNEKQFQKLKSAGVTRIHNNLETSRGYFPEVCTTHTFDDKINSITAAKNSGLSVCSGGIMGLGESMEDRIDMALTLRDLDIHSVPLNILNPIPGTPYESNEKLSNDDVCRIAALYRFILPDASIRLAGGRGLLPDKGRKCFRSGANAAISGDMLTTAGITIDDDMNIIKDLGYIPALRDM